MNVAWSEIVAHRERLLRLASRRCPSPEDAEDVVHEAMVRAATFESLDRERLGQFLTSVTVRLCADVYRTAERGTRAARRLDPDVEPSPEQLAVAAADADELRTLLATLPESQRNVIVDRAEGFSVAQISQRHALSYKAVESALSRARARLRVALATTVSVLAAAFAAVRRRPVAAMAVPLTAVAIVTGVRLAPFDTAPAPDAARVAPAVRAPAPARNAAAAAGARVAAPRPAARRQAARIAMPRVRAAARADVRKRPRPVQEIRFEPAPPVRGRVWRDDETPVELVTRCATAESYEPGLDVRLDGPAPRVVAHPYCRPHKS